MQIKLTWRRLALTTTLVLAGALAPLAYAAVAGKGGSPGRAVAGSPTRFSTPPLLSPARSPQAVAATADNPYQVIANIPATGACASVPLPAGTDFVLQQVMALSNGGFSYAYVQPRIKASTDPGDYRFGQLDVPLDATQDAAARSFDLVVRPDSFVAAAVGDIYDIRVCASGPTTSLTVTFVFTGQRLATGATVTAVDAFRARATSAGTILRWTTGSESNVLGFNIWRYRGNKGVKVNSTLIRAKRSGEPTGASYTYRDNHPGAARGITYRLQLVNLNGQRSWYAAFAIPA
jgi:hypothetical protein